MAERDAKPLISVLFVCTSNAIRSAMAEGLLRLRFGPLARVESVGVRPAIEVDPLAVEVMDDLGAEISRHRPKGFDVLDEGVHFDVIVSLSPEAHHYVLSRAIDLADETEYWPTFDASLAEGSRSQRLEEYRLVRDALDRRIAQRFPRPHTG